MGEKVDDRVHNGMVMGWTWGKPQHYDEPHWFVKHCAEHPSAEVERTTKHLGVCDHMFSCKCPTVEVTYTCPVEGCASKAVKIW